jgi:predicted secreted protein
MTAPLLQLTEQQNDQALDVAQGGRVIVSLGSNHDTGYAWTFAAPVPSELKQEGDTRYDAPPPRMGAWGREVFTFVAAAPGSAKLRLKYARASDNGAAPSRTFSIILNVRSNGSMIVDDEPAPRPRKTPTAKKVESQNSAVITRKAAPAKKATAAKKSTAKKPSAKRATKH